MVSGRGREGEREGEREGGREGGRDKPGEDFVQIFFIGRQSFWTLLNLIFPSAHNITAAKRTLENTGKRTHDSSADSWERMAPEILDLC